jgi:hypothetical protein
MIQPAHADQGVRETSRDNALKDSKADLPYAKMTDFGRHDKAALLPHHASFRHQHRRLAPIIPASDQLHDLHVRSSYAVYRSISDN